MKRIISMALILALLCGVLSACSTLEDGDKGAIIDVYFTDELYNFDPALSYTDDSMVKITALLFEGLTYLDDNGNWKKAIMDKYTYLGVNAVLSDEATGVLDDNAELDQMVFLK